MPDTTDNVRFQDTAESPARSYGSLTPSDTVDLTNLTKALYVGGAGNLVAVSISGEVVTFTAVPAGTVLPIRVKRVNATGTTATAIVALY